MNSRDLVKQRLCHCVKAGREATVQVKICCHFPLDIQPVEHLSR